MPALAMNPAPTIKITDYSLIDPVIVRFLDDTYERQIERSVALEAQVWQNCLNDLKTTTVYLPNSIDSLEFERFLPLMQACSQQRLVIPLLNGLTDDQLLKTFRLADCLNCRHIYKKSSEILKQRLTHPLKLQSFMAKGSFGFSTPLNNQTVLRLSRAMLKNHPAGMYWLIRQQATEKKSNTLSMLKEYGLPTNKEVAKVIYGDNNNPYFMIHYTDGTLTILDKKNCNELILEPKLDPILYAQFCKDQPFLILLTYAGKTFAFYVFDYKTGKKVIALRHEVPETFATTMQSMNIQELITSFFHAPHFYCFDKQNVNCALFFPGISSMLAVNLNTKMCFNIHSASLDTFTFNEDGSQYLAWYDGIFINAYKTHDGAMTIYKIPFDDVAISCDPNLRIKKVCFDLQNIITVWLQNGTILEKWKIIDGAWHFIEKLNRNNLDNDYKKECATYDQSDAVPQASTQGCENLSCAPQSLEKLSCGKFSGSVCSTTDSTVTNFTDENNLNLFDLPNTLDCIESRNSSNPLIAHCSDRTIRLYQVCNPETERYMLNNLTLEQTALLLYAYECKKNKLNLDFSLYPQALTIFEQLPASLQKTLRENLGVIYPQGTTYRPENDSSTALIKPEDAVGSNLYRLMTHIITTQALQGTSSNPSNDSQE